MGKKPNSEGVAAKLELVRGPGTRTNGEPVRREDRSGLRTLGPVSDLERHLPLSFHEGDARRFRLGDGEFHCVCILGNSFGYFDRPEDDLAVLEAVKRALASGGILVMDLMDGEWMRRHFEARSWEWVDQNHFVCRERGLAGDGDRLISREVVVHAERGVIADQFYSERLYSQQRIETLIARAGFTNIRFHPVAAPDSARNQDLGMVEHRLFVTSEAPRRVARLT